MRYTPSIVPVTSDPKQVAEFLTRELRKIAAALQAQESTLVLVDGVAAPAQSRVAQIFIDEADGDLKIIFSDNVTKTIVVDT